MSQGDWSYSTLCPPPSPFINIWYCNSWQDLGHIVLLYGEKFIGGFIIREGFSSPPCDKLYEKSWIIVSKMHYIYCRPERYSILIKESIIGRIVDWFTDLNADCKISMKTIDAYCHFDKVVTFLHAILWTTFVNMKNSTMPSQSVNLSKSSWYLNQFGGGGTPGDSSRIQIWDELSS